MSATRSQVASPPANGVRAGLVPTNSVTTSEGYTVRARIDPTLTVDDIVKQLCVNLKIKGAPSEYALRDITDELVTDDNVRKKIKTKIDLKCVPCNHPIRCIDWRHRLVAAPSREAKDIITKLSQRDEKTLRLTLFSLQKFIRVRIITPTRHVFSSSRSQEQVFANHFIENDGLFELVQVINTSHGNTLAVSYTSYG